MSFKILNCAFQHFRFFLEQGDCGIAGTAQKLSHLAGLMAMVNVQDAMSASLVWRFSTYRASVVLTLNHFSMGLFGKAVRAKENVDPVFSWPVNGFSVGASARLAFRPKPIGAFSSSLKIARFLDFFAFRALLAFQCWRKDREQSLGSIFLVCIAAGLAFIAIAVPFKTKIGNGFNFVALLALLLGYAWRGHSVRTSIANGLTKAKQMFSASAWPILFRPNHTINTVECQYV